MNEVLRDPDVEKAQRAMKAVLGMGKIDMAEVQRAVDLGLNEHRPADSLTTARERAHPFRRPRRDPALADMEGQGRAAPSRY